MTIKVCPCGHWCFGPCSLRVFLSTLKIFRVDTWTNFDVYVNVNAGDGPSPRRPPASQFSRRARAPSGARAASPPPRSVRAPSVRRRRQETSAARRRQQPLRRRQNGCENAAQFRALFRVKIARPGRAATVLQPCWTVLHGTWKTPPRRFRPTHPEIVCCMLQHGCSTPKVRFYKGEIARAPVLQQFAYLNENHVH